MLFSRAQNNPGFTIVEVLIIAPIMLLTLAAFVGVLVNITGETLIARAQNKLVHDTESALGMIENDVRLSGSFLSENNFDLSSPQGYDHTSDQKFNTSIVNRPKSMIINAHATKNGNFIESRDLVWKKDDPHPCSSGGLINRNDTLNYNIVYYMLDGQLWRRTILPPNYSLHICPGQNVDQKQSCHPEHSASNCQVEDTLVLSDIDSIEFNYYSSASSNTPLEADSIATAGSLQVKIVSKKTVAGEDISYVGTVRSTRSGSQN